MKLLYSWLNDFIKVDDLTPEFVADRFLNIGFEVEEIVRFGENIKNVVVGKITAIEPHPNADKLKICSVDVGAKTLTIVTGAKNVSEGDVVPVALDGAELPDGKKIVSAPLRGIMSEGMMCGGSELALTDGIVKGADVDGILILPQNLTLGADIVSALRLKDCILDVSLTANRPDCQSVYGLARELGTAIKRKVRRPDLGFTISSEATSPDVKISATDVCDRYTGTMITDVRVGESPEIIRRRLTYCGIRPINNVVDITNYVLLEIGQPLHAFDAALIDGDVNVRYAAKGEKLVALNGVEYKLDSSALLICDDKKPLAIAGVMGGEFSGINADTGRVFLESARFARGSVRHTSRALGLRSDSSARFEKGVDYLCVSLGRARALHLFDKLKIGKIAAPLKETSVKNGEAFFTTYSKAEDEVLPERRIIKTDMDRINSVLGITVPYRDAKRILSALDFGVEGNAGTMDVAVPLFRDDVDNFTDLAEEIIRFYGYDNLGETMLERLTVTVGGETPAQKRMNEIKNAFCACGCFETMSYSFIGETQCRKVGMNTDGMIRILNPLSEEYAYMRTQLLSSMLETVKLNLSRQNEEFRLFEQSKVFIPRALPLKELPEEREHLVAAFVGKDEDFYKMKEVCEIALRRFAPDMTFVKGSSECFHPGISADIIACGEKIGTFGLVHPRVAKNYEFDRNVFAMEIDLQKILAAEIGAVKFEPLPKYPVVDRDLAMVVDDEVAVGEIISVIRAVSPLIRSVDLFDVYRGAQVPQGKKSVAVSVKLCDKNKTMTEDEINKVMREIVSELGDKLDARLRE